MNQVATQNQERNPAMVKFDTIRAHLEKRKGEFANVLPRHLTPERLTRIALTTIANNPKLMECDVKSLMAAVMTSAQLGLEPDGILGQAYIVPFAGKAQLIPGYKGLLTLARNGGDVLEIYAHVVRENDHFKFNQGTNEIDHQYSLTENRGNPIAFYAVAKFREGGKQMEVMSLADVEKIRDNSQGYKTAKKYNKTDSPWMAHFDEMGRKTVLRRLVKYLPLNIHKLRAAVAIEDSVDAGKLADINPDGMVDVHDGEVLDDEGNPTPTPKTKAEKLKDELAEKQAESEKQQNAMKAAATPCGECKGKGFVDWVNQETGEVGTEPCPMCRPINDVIGPSPFN